MDFLIQNGVNLIAAIQSLGGWLEASDHQIKSGGDMAIATPTAVNFRIVIANGSDGRHFL